MRGNEPELLKKIAGGDWSDETQKAVDAAVKQFAEDFGYDLDEEGHPLEEGDLDQVPRTPRRSDGDGVRGRARSEQESEEAVTA